MVGMMELMKAEKSAESMVRMKGSMKG